MLPLSCVRLFASCIVTEVFLPLQGYWGLSCDRGQHCIVAGELMWEHQQQTIYPMPLWSFCAGVSFYGTKTREKQSLQGVCYLACCAVVRRCECPPGRTIFEKMFVVRVCFFFQLWGRHSLCTLGQKNHDVCAFPEHLAARMSVSVQDVCYAPPLRNLVLRMPRVVSIRSSQCNSDTQNMFWCGRCCVIVRIPFDLIFL